MTRMWNTLSAECLQGDRGFLRTTVDLEAFRR